MKKRYISLLFTLALISCGAKKNTNNDPVGLKNKFYNETNLFIYHRNTISNDGQYLYTTTYPLNTISFYGCYETFTPEQIANKENSFTYRYSQTLSLSKDFTYRYIFSISFGNPNNNDNLLSIEADIVGKYNYQVTGENSYLIDLFSPSEGTESFYGCHLSLDELFWFGGGIAAKHDSPDKVIDFALQRKVGKEELDWYVRSRMVSVTVNPEVKSENHVEDSLFNAFFLDDVGQFCTY